MLKVPKEINIFCFFFFWCDKIMHYIEGLPGKDEDESSDGVGIGDENQVAQPFQSRCFIQGV